MDESTKLLKGSPSRDLFKQAHKIHCPRTSYACDLDFILVAKYPFRIIAFLDYKTETDPIRFSEVIAYNSLKALADMYIIRSSDPENGPFKIWHYKGGDPKPDPPHVILDLTRQCESWIDLNIWEQELRIGNLIKC